MQERKVNKTERLLVALTPKQLQKLDNLRKKLPGIPGRAEAVRWLIDRGFPPSKIRPPSNDAREEES
jgi:hypothetical protein